VRRLVRAMGHRYRSQMRSLPGTPDFVLPELRAAILVHGCFWHGHACRSGRKRPKANAAYWEAKWLRNRVRDARVRRQLRARGWRVLVVWECQLKNFDQVRSRIKKRLAAP